MSSVEPDTEAERLRQLNQNYQDMVLFTAYEWRNQLSVLSLAIDHLKHEIQNSLDAKQQAVFLRIQQSTASLRRITRLYLNFGQIENLPFVVYPRYFDPIQELIEQSRFSYATQLAASGQTCRIRTSAPHLKIWGDKHLLLTVYDSLLSNAIKYGNPHGEIIFGIEERDTAYELSVWNSGPGINEEHLETIFEPAARIRTGDASSTGLGLYLSRKIAEAHGGHLRVDSLPGEWTIVVLELPRPSQEIAPDVKRKTYQS